ncbi:uncharacterized protein si:ch211-191i18.2 [Periophthalmus magnuspinnatus]|uniref:uncharacterized protein si:ch211-191i18.2 n=1 Tax=Periophthalmus magnuspinnatus TaxID=409849 RepID=UPI0024372662|nr:uncharacterized protein si:ch211-191i18.2 [Periophthalmus magnuspinnatus]
MSLCVSVFGLVCLVSLFSGCEGRSSTPAPDYDYNSTFYYTFYSNASHDDLEEFLNSSDVNGDEEETFSTETASETPIATTAGAGVRGAASLPVCADSTLMWTLSVMILNAPRAL